MSHGVETSMLPVIPYWEWLIALYMHGIHHAVFSPVDCMGRTAN